MNQYVTGAVIRELREKKGLTQAELAERLYVSDKTVSKWENGKGYPDITLLEAIAGAFGISVTELLAGKAVENANVSANMLRSKFYVCPVCGNVLHSMGEAAISCHGVMLAPLQAEETDEHHMILIEGVEDEYFIRIEHEMTKQHYISFVAALRPDGIELVKLYPEGNAQTRVKMRGVKRICFYCNRDGLFSVNVHRAIDGKPGAYDNAEERRQLEAAAQRIFG
ncbi:MAG: helix-turn-helix domain-containing protein [Clostridia bacterium]|nr:helix-turn-helix domain-containing protein [Clostridia bacterium]MBR6786462.1 helix-turn-helix domain-containing protein [Clostridia bacterium]